MDGVAQRRILVVDDEAPIRVLLARILTAEGYEVQCVENGAHALRYLAQHSVQLVITDLIMPEIEGLETIREIRRLYRGVRVIAMSGGGRFTPEGYLAIALELGADRVFGKPFAKKELLEAVHGLLGS